MKNQTVVRTRSILFYYQTVYLLNFFVLEYLYLFFCTGIFVLDILYQTKPFEQNRLQIIVFECVNQQICSIYYVSRTYFNDICLHGMHITRNVGHFCTCGGLPIASSRSWIGAWECSTKAKNTLVRVKDKLDKGFLNPLWSNGLCVYCELLTESILQATRV